MKFEKIACADHPGLPQWVYPKLQKLSKQPILPITEYPLSNAEIIANIGDADCALVSWNTIINREVIEACPSLKYIGMCCSLIDENSANVDITTAKSKNIDVRGVRDYGDEGVIEFIVSQLIQLLKGIGKYQWKKDQLELGHQKIGIIGMGTTGKMMAKAALFFNMNVSYYSRSRKSDMENYGCNYLPLNELLQTVDIISLHLPKNTALLTPEHFKNFGNGKILINTTLGTCFHKTSFINWMKEPGNYSIMDGSGMGANANEFQLLPNLISTPKTSGFTHEAKNRLAQKVLENIEAFLNSNLNHS